MYTKRILLTSTAVAAALAVSSDAHAGQLYVSVFGGANWLQDKSGVAFSSGGSSEGTFFAKADTGFLVGGAVGLHLDNWVKDLRVELEGSYRRNDVHGKWCDSVTCLTGGTFGGHLSTFALMANVWYDVDIGSKLKPYFGGGAGYARTTNDAVYLTTFTSGGPISSLHSSPKGEHFGMAWQLGVGVNYEVMPGVDLGVGYRYFRGPSADNFFSEARYDGGNHTVAFSLTVGMP